MSDTKSVGASSASINRASLRSTLPFDPTAVFDSPPRPSLRINPLKAALNVSVAFSLIAAILAGYVIGLRIFDLGVTSIGLYGTVLMSEYFVQLACAIFNRYDVNRIASRLKKETSGDCEKGAELPNGLYNPTGEVSIVVVGYREDEQAWRQCLRSVQTQTLKPKCMIGVVDGNEEPDLSMAQAFVDELESYKAPLIHLPILLSSLHRKTYFDNIPVDTRSVTVRAWHTFTGLSRPGHQAALALAKEVVIKQVGEWDIKWNISSMDAVCFSQPHGHKRTAMFTAFAMSLYALRTKDAVFTTDSDTLVRENGLDEMLSILRSSPDIGGVTADVKIWNRAEGLLTRLCAARYWFAFNIERACQSTWRCVGCLSGPMSMYRSSDLDTILGPWNLQTFGGKETTFGDDRHLTNQLLAHGLNTRYTHRTWCDSESPTAFVRWVAQQTRWSKSFFREAFWFPASFAYQSPWLLLEMTIQTLYPFILVATVFHLLYDTSDSSKWRPVIWLVTMFGIALFKSTMALLVCWDPWLLLFSIYGFIYFFGLLPSKIWALFTMNQTAWGTSARSASERKRGQTFMQRSFHVGHLVIWFTAVFVGTGYFVYRLFDNALFFLIGAAALLASMFLYWDRSNFDFAVETIVLWFKGKRGDPGSTAASSMDTSALPERPAPVLTSSSTKEELASVGVTPVVNILEVVPGLDMPKKAAEMQ